MPDNRKFVIFDLDGTLIDSYECVLRCINKCLTYFDKSALRIEGTAKPSDLFQKVFNLYPDIEQSLFKDLFDKIHYNDIDGIRIKEDVLVKLLSFKRYAQIVIFTNKNIKIAKKILSNFNIIEHCDFIVGRDSNKSIKNTPEVLSVFFKENNLFIGNCISYFGDSQEDEHLSRTLNIHFTYVN